MDAAEFSVDDTHGFVKLESFDVCRTSAGLGWAAAYLSVQSEAPYTKSFQARPDVLIAVIDTGSIRANIGTREGIQYVRGPAGSVTIIPDGMAFNMDLHTPIQTTHLYLRRAVLDEVASRIYRGDPSDIEFIARMAIFDPLLTQLCHAIRDALDEDPEMSGLYVEHMANAVAAHLIRQHSNADRQRRQAPSNARLSALQLARTRKMIEARLGERLTTADLAADTRMSAEHFGRLFKQATGTTLYQFLIRRRVDRASRLLTETAMPIIEIADECGFADQVHLTRAFGRIVGTTPAAFRRKRQR